MKHHISLKLFVTLAFLLLAGVLVTGYSLLSAHYYRMGMKSIMASNMEEAARSYIELVPLAKRNQLNNFRDYQVTANWSQMPLEILNFLAVPPSEQGLTIKGNRSSWLKPPEILCFIYRYQDEGNTLFVSHWGARATAPPIIGHNTAESMKILLAISSAIAGVLGITIFLLLRRVSQPVAALGQWARSLDEDNLSNPPPDFFYPELNDLAGLIKNSLSSVQESLDRERTFLRHASHELRTPISIIRNNVELLHKIEENNAAEKTGQHQKVIGRIDRASLNMQSLTETLLWLSRKEIEKLPGKKLDLGKLPHELVEEMSYLLDRKEIEVKINTNPCTVFLPEFPVRIVLGNLIRNAFQHSWHGCINIHQKGSQITIINPRSPEGADQNDLGFGLGLQLTIQLTNKLGWRYIDESTPATYQTSIIFGDD